MTNAPHRHHLFEAAVAFAGAARAATNADALLALMVERCAPLGVERLARLPFLAPGAEPAIGTMVGRTDPQWVAHYEQNGFVRHDVALAAALKAPEPVLWSAVQRRCASRAERDVFSAAGDFGMNEGLVIPIHHWRGAVHGVVFAGRHFEATPDHVAFLHLVGVHFNSAVERLDLEAAGGKARTRALTARQVECLKWVAAGKTDWEIGEILRLSENTVHHHIERAKARLDVRTRAQAVMALVQQRLFGGD